METNDTQKSRPTTETPPTPAAEVETSNTNTTNTDSSVSALSSSAATPASGTTTTTTEDNNNNNPPKVSTLSDDCHSSLKNENLEIQQDHNEGEEVEVVVITKRAIADSATATSSTTFAKMSDNDNDKNETVESEVIKERLLSSSSSSEDDPNSKIPPYKHSTLKCLCWPCLVGSAATYVACCCCIRKPRHPTWNRMFETAVTILRSGAGNCIRNFGALRLITDPPIGVVPTWLPSLPKHVENSDNTTAPPEGGGGGGGGEWFWPLPQEKTRNSCRRCLTCCCFCCRTYRPTHDPQHLVNLGNPDRVILYLHGGAFVLCTSKTHRSLIMRLVNCTNAIVLAINYRRPPEHPWPAPVEDCLESYRWLLEEKHVDPANIIFAGDSAGGGLVVQTMAMARENGLPMPAGGIMWSPYLDLTDSYSGTWTTNQDTDFLPRDWAYKFATAYAGGEEKEKLVQASPMNASLEGLPPLLVEVGEAECLRDSVLAWVEKARDAGVDIELVRSEGMVHVYPLFAAFAKKGLPPHIAYENAAKFADRVFGQSSGGGGTTPSAVTAIAEENV